MAAGESSSKLLILPGSSAFEETLAATLTPGWKSYAAKHNEIYFVTDSSGLMRPANHQELTEYLEGGEYEERLQDIGETDVNGHVYDDEAGLIYAFD